MDADVRFEVIEHADGWIELHASLQAPWRPVASFYLSADGARALALQLMGRGESKE